MIRVWGRPNSINVQKVMWAIAELDLAHERIDAGGAFGGLDTPEYARLNPNRKIPVIQDGETVVWESNAVVRYLAAAYGAGALWPEQPAARAEADRWMDWQLTEIAPLMHPIFWGLVRTPAERRDRSAIDRAAEAIGPVWGVLDAHLADRPFVGGGHLTMGDIPVGCAYWRYRNLEVSRPELPHLERWFARLAERPGYRAHVMLPLS